MEAFSVSVLVNGLGQCLLDYLLIILVYGQDSFILY